MQANTKLVLVLLGLLAAQGYCQDFTGGHLDHLYTGMMRIENDDGSAIDENTYNHVLTRSDVFSLTEDLHIGTSILDYSHFPLNFNNGDGNQHALHIEVINPHMNGIRNTFMLELELDSDLVNSPPERS